MKKRWILLFVLLFVIIMISSVYALNACCELDVNGDWCTYQDESQCDNNYLSAYTSCEQTSYCQVGCCYSSDTGSCYKSAPKASCEFEKYSWSDSDTCDIDQCQKGCCVIGDQAFYVTEVKCKSVGTQYEDAAVKFDDSIGTEAACLNSVKNLDWGCCVSADEAKFVTREECSSVSTEVGTNFTIEGFHEGMLCSNDLLSAECAKEQYTGCYQGKVYWYDSCGNRENIYSSDERTSYNEGYVLAEKDSCTASGPDDPNCGNCDYSLGMLCGDDENNKALKGDYICTDLNCYDTYENSASSLSGGDKKNGESWCIYDARTGMGLDTVGSRHYRHLCINGEEMTEPCTDYREEICIAGVLTEEVLDTLEALHLNGGDYVEAACRENRASECSSCNDPALGVSDRNDCCRNEDLRDCYWMPVEGIVDINDGICVAQVPQGLKFWSTSGSGDDASSSSECSAASTECVATYRIGGFAKIFGGSDNRDKWELISESPDGCTTKEWVVEQNTYCRALGDCGAWYNYVGEAGFDGLSSSMFDEEFFFEVNDITVNDLEDWNYMQSVDVTDEGNIWGFSSSKFYKNPVFIAAIVSTIAGGISGISGCESADKAEDYKSFGDFSVVLQACKKNAQDDFDRVNKDDKKTTEDKTKAQGIYDQAITNCNSVNENSIKAWEINNKRSRTEVTDSTTKAPMYAAGSDTIGFIGGAGCFLTSAVPVFGLLGSAEGTISGNELNIATVGSYATQLQGVVKNIKTASTFTKWMNGVTIVAIGYLIVEYGFDNETTMTYYANCNMWQPPKGGDDCELCNDENTPCSEYRCHSLGASCSLVNEGTSNETCVSLYVNDVNSPVIEPLDSVLEEQRFTYVPTEEEGDKGYILNEKVKAFTPITLGVSTDEPAQCKFNTDAGVDYEEMANYFGSEIYLYNHSITFSLGSEVVDEQILALTEGVYTIYLRCSDANGNANERDYFIRFTVDTTPDLTPPQIEYTSIESGSYMPYGLNETGLTIYTNEPSTCKWDENDVDYNVMNGEMECATSGFQQSSVYFGTYECSTTLTGVSDNSINTYYFKCEDQSGNFNEEGYKFTLKKTEDPLEITYVAPEDTIYNSTVTLEVKTEDGAENGKAVCGFSPENVDYGLMIMFADTNTTAHEQVLELIPGDYKYYFACQDKAGNQDSDNITFSVDVDNDAPAIESLYVDTIYSYLEIELNEDATCEYAVEDFNYGEGTQMSGVGTEMQETYIDAAAYYVICEDQFGNSGEYYIDLSTWV